MATMRCRSVIACTDLGTECHAQDTHEHIHVLHSGRIGEERADAKERRRRRRSAASEKFRANNVSRSRLLETIVQICSNTLERRTGRHSCEQQTFSSGILIQQLLSSFFDAECSPRTPSHIYDFVPLETDSISLSLEAPAVSECTKLLFPRDV